jgi:hypothetical protein
MKDKLSEREHRSCYIDDTEAARKMKEKLSNRLYRSCQEDEREKSGRGYRSCHVDDTEAVRKMKLPDRRYRSCQEDERQAVRERIQKLQGTSATTWGNEVKSLWGCLLIIADL